LPGTPIYWDLPVSYSWAKAKTDDLNRIVCAASFGAVDNTPYIASANRIFMTVFIFVSAYNEEKAILQARACKTAMRLTLGMSSICILAVDSASGHIALAKGIVGTPRKLAGSRIAATDVEGYVGQDKAEKAQKERSSKPARMRQKSNHAIGAPSFSPYRAFAFFCAFSRAIYLNSAFRGTC
jgi:hypothetical protein